ERPAPLHLPRSIVLRPRPSHSGQSPQPVPKGKPVALLEIPYQDAAAGNVPAVCIKCGADATEGRFREFTCYPWQTSVVALLRHGTASEPGKPPATGLGRRERGKGGDGLGSPSRLRPT